MGTCQAVIDGNTCECGFESESVNEFAGDNCKKNRNDQLILSEFRIVLIIVISKGFFLDTTTNFYISVQGRRICERIPTEDIWHIWQWKSSNGYI